MPNKLQESAFCEGELEIGSAAEGWGWSDIQIRPRPDRQNLLLKGT